jgi:GNAT superfamily N-acetyltransferase
MMATRGEAPGGHHDATSGTTRGASKATPSTAPSARAESARSAAPRSVPSVRRATYADLPTVVELRLALLREHGDHAVYGRLRADARERAYEVFGSQLRSPTEVMLLAERDGEVVGVLRCVDTPNSPLLYPDRYCYVSSVYVRPVARRGGVLKALLRQARAWCAERGLGEMRLHNVPDGIASAAWDAEGFSIIEQVRIKGLEARD